MRVQTLGMAAALAASTGGAYAATLFVTATVGTRSASALFENDNGVLQITLTNESAFDALAPVDILTALFFDITPPPVPLTRLSATVAPGSTVFFGSTDPGNIVGGEMAYSSGLSGAPGNAGLGVSSIGAGLFGPGDLFPGSNLQGPTSPDGLQYGLTSTGDNMVTGNSAVTGDFALIRNAVIYRLGGLPLDFDPSTRITNVSFQYGTDLSEPNIPTPGAVALLGLAGLIAGRRRR